MRTVLLVALLCACNPFAKHHEASGVVSDDLATLRDLYVKTKASYVDLADQPTGWLAVSDCDAALFNGLVAAAGLPVKTELGEKEPGKLYRRPGPDCYVAGESSSTISRDMLVGYFWAYWRTRNLGAAERLADYGQAHSWIMGEPFPAAASRVVMSVNDYGILGRLIFALSGGKEQRDYFHVPAVFLPVAADYEKHIQVLSILLDGEITGGNALALDIDTLMLNRLQSLADDSPNDALFQAALGVYTADFAPAIRLLLDEEYVFPSYVRGSTDAATAAYQYAHWVFAANIVLTHSDGGVPSGG